mmetsp:Transcript_88835/g.276176  ORF Transcript_88835/g.276176 Transcript_88835/m.276176 type:complete len:231 (+) Transcript_88835:352-1044(+)
MPHAGQQLPPRGVGQRDVARGAPLVVALGTDGALCGLRDAAPRAPGPIAHHCEDLEVVELSPGTVRVNRVDDGVPHCRNDGLALLGAKLAHDLELLGDLLVLELAGLEVHLELAVALVAQFEERIRPQVLLGPLGEERLEAEVRAHHGKTAADGQPHELHRGAGRDSDHLPASRRARGAARAAGERKTPVAATAATLPIKRHGVRRHGTKVGHEVGPHRGGRRHRLRRRQ